MSVEESFDHILLSYPWAYKLLGISWIMVGNVKDESGHGRIFAVGKSMWVSFSLLFSALCEKKEIGVFEMVEANFDRIKDRWFQIVSLSITSHSMHTTEAFGNLIDILIEV